MKKFMLLAVMVALVVPVAAFATGAPTPSATASRFCKQAQTSMGATLFAQTYASNASKSNAFGKCTSKNAAVARQDVNNAAKSCKALQTDPNFAMNHGGKTFAQYYGNAKGKNSVANAYGKCVAMAVSASITAQAKVTVSAAKSCKAALKASASSFATKYGTGTDAFGKCVALTATAK